MPLIVHTSGERVASLALASPPANALGTALLAELDSALQQVGESGARVLVVSSEVPGFFIAGADLKLLAQADTDGFEAYLKTLRGVLDRLTALPQTTIAALDGMALGGGLELAMACTLRVVSPTARLGVPEIRLGMLPGAYGTQRLTRLVGPSRALDLLLTGRSMGGEEAHSCGLADRLADDALEAADELAVQLARYPRTAAEAGRRCVEAAIRHSEAGNAVELAEILALFDGDDGREGIAAFVQKRPPAFS